MMSKPLWIMTGICLATAVCKTTGSEHAWALLFVFAGLIAALAIVVDFEERKR